MKDSCFFNEIIRLLVLLLPCRKVSLSSQNAIAVWYRIKQTVHDVWVWCFEHKCLHEEQKRKWIYLWGSRLAFNLSQSHSQSNWLHELMYTQWILFIVREILQLDCLSQHKFVWVKIWFFEPQLWLTTQMRIWNIWSPFSDTNCEFRV